MSHLNDDFEKDLQTLLRNSEQSLSGAVEHRLNQIKRDAFVAAEAVDKRGKKSHFWPAFSAVAASLVLAGVLILPSSETNFNSATYQEISANSEDDLYRNLDFYQWLAESELNNNG